MTEELFTDRKRKISLLAAGIAAVTLALILASSPATAVDTDVGEEIYSEKCWYCHQDDGMGTGLWGQPNFTREELWLNSSKDEFISLVENGGEVMPGFGNLSRDQVKDVLGYTVSFADLEYEDIGRNARAATVDAVEDAADAATDGEQDTTDSPDAEDTGNTEETNSPGFTALTTAAGFLIGLLILRRR